MPFLTMLKKSVMKTGPDPPPCRKCYTFFFFEGFPYLFLSKITMPKVFTLKEQGSQNSRSFMYGRGAKQMPRRMRCLDELEAVSLSV